MTAAAENLLVRFRSRDTQFGVTRGTVKALAKELDVNETQVIHMALSKFATDVLPAYAPDDGPLTAKYAHPLEKVKRADLHSEGGVVFSQKGLLGQAAWHCSRIPNRHTARPMHLDQYHGRLR